MIVYKRNKYRIIYAILIILIIISIIYITNLFLLKVEAIKESEVLANINFSEQELKEEIYEKNIDINNENIVKETEQILKVKKLKEENQDIIGWISIEGTNINYPVLQGTDNEYYMTHNYKKEKSKNGSIFLTKDYDWNIPSTNLLIFGHNLGNGAMFQDLLKYEDKEFYKQHKIISFTTETEETKYEVISIFKSRVYYKSETNVFRYYYFVNAESEYEYDEFIKNAKKASLYTIDETAKYGDQLITLSTCSYHVKDGRFAVVGKKVEM